MLRTTGPQGFVYTNLVPTVALGTWHHLVMHVVPKGAATGVQIWWDDKSVFAQTVNISATRFDKVQLGAEHDQQMGDIFVDDVIVNSGSETPGPVPGTLPGAGGGGGGGTVPPAATTEIKAAAAAKPALGPSTSAIICGLVKGGCYQRFQAGAVHYAPGVGAFATWGGIRTAWRAVGTENGKLGYPTGKETCGLVKGGCYQRFQGGAIHYAPGVGAFATWGSIRTAWRAVGTENGKLGYPVSKEICGLRNGGCYQAFQGGTIHYVPGTGAFATWGGIRTAWGKVGYERGKLRYPIGKETCGLVKGGCYQRFQGGTIHYAPGVGAFATWGSIRTAWRAVGTENGKLGYPVSKEICGLRNGGCYQAFQGGTIHYVPGIGAFATWGGIRTAWGAVGYEHGKLGYPVGKENCGLRNGGCYQRFQGGTIHYAPGVGAFATWGGIRAAWGSPRLRKGTARLPHQQRVPHRRRQGRPDLSGGTDHLVRGRWH